METKKKNWFVRSLVLVFILFLLGIILINYFFSASPYNISPGIITVLGLVTILILSETFDNLNFGKILSLNRDLQSHKTEKERLIDENNTLRNQLIQTIQNELNFRIAQSSSNINLNANGVDLKQLINNLNVVESKVDEANQPSEEELLSESKEEIQVEPVDSKQVIDIALRRKQAKAIKNELINRFLLSHQLNSIEFKADVEFSENFKFVDPIMDKRVIYDGYLFFDKKEYFFGVINEDSYISTDRLYIQLAKILFYKQVKNSDAVLILLFAETNEPSKIDARKKRILSYFQPAITSGLLRLEGIPVTLEEIAKIKKDV